MTDTTLTAIVEAFGWRPDRSMDRTWLPPGFDESLRALAAWYGDISDATLWAVALLLVVIDRGGTCLPLADMSAVDGFAALPQEIQNFTADQWRAELVGESFSRGDDLVRPLVVAHDRLYFDRFFQAEQSVAAELLRPLHGDALVAPPRWADVVGEVFANDIDGLGRQLAHAIWEHRVHLLAGGPGTGKTTSVARLLIALARASDTLPKIRLCAPTGKAAQRMGTAIAAAIDEIDPGTDDETRSLLSPVTIHSLLAISPSSPRRTSTTQLDFDFVICDETSMVDIVLLSELLRSLSPSCRILLVGDPHQLQSVDVGSVMGDLVDAARRGRLAMTHLERTHRLDADLSDQQRQRLLSFFAAIRAGESPDALMNHLGESDDVLTLIDADRDGEMMALIEPAWTLVVDRAKHLRHIATTDPTPEAIESSLNSVMVLTAQHQGPLGRLWWVERVSVALNNPVPAYPALPGTPVLITGADRTNGLTNGDTGLVLARHGVVVYQPSRAGLNAPPLRPTAIQHWQPWWAMTIHKSQGSEFDTVIVSITPGTALLSRELIYTAVTRARRRVILIGRREDISDAFGRTLHRYTGLVDVLVAKTAEHD